MKKPQVIRKFIYGITFFFLALTGFGQMPVYKRYYISDIPGLDWISNFYFTHMLHYIASFVLITLAVYVIISYIFRSSNSKATITATGYFKIIVLAGLIISGVLMVVRNLPDVYLWHNLIIALDLIHLALSMMLIAASFYTLITKKSWIK